MNKAGFSKSVLCRRGFTVVELLVALLVTSIVLGAVANLSYAVGRAIESTEKLNHSQRTLRYATLRIGELIRHAKLVISNPTNESIAIWTADDKKEDNKINGSELVYIEFSDGSQELRMLEFPFQSEHVTIAGITDGSARTTLIDMTDEQVTVLAEDVTNAFFTHGSATAKYVVMDFALNIDSVRTGFQIRARAGASADNLIDQAGELVIGDDD